MYRQLFAIPSRVTDHVVCQKTTFLFRIHHNQRIFAITYSLNVKISKKSIIIKIVVHFSHETAPPDPVTAVLSFNTVVSSIRNVEPVETKIAPPLPVSEVALLIDVPNSSNEQRLAKGRKCKTSIDT